MREREWIARLIAAAIFVGWSSMALDTALRRDTGESVWRHLGAASLMHAAVFTVVGSVLAALVAVHRVVRERLAGRAPRLARTSGAILAGTLVCLLSAPTVFVTFAGEGVRESTLARWGPYAAFGILFAAAGLAVWLAEAALVGIRRGRLAWPVALTAAMTAAAGLLAYIDLTVYVSLYARLHTMLELASVLLMVTGLGLVLTILGRRFPRLSAGYGAMAGLGVVAVLGWASIERIRVWADESLRHVWRSPIYVGRTLSRVQLAESFLRDPLGWRGAAMSQVVRLRQRFDIATTARSPRWDEPLDEPAWFRERLRALRPSSEYNILVYYVDTLRADVAADPALMPNVVELAKTGLSFRKAYSTGSNTLHALPGLTGGSYDLDAPQANDVLRVARLAGMHTVLLSARSAHEFLARLLPRFQFDESVTVGDYAPGNKEVWGYGADQPTAARLVDRTIDWLAENRGQRFLAWIFNFDVHNWREMDEAYVRSVAKLHGVQASGPPSWRYRALVRAVDEQLGRLLTALEEMGLDDNTIVIFVSDHGEALGREGFWVHSVFLWECLVRVPLILRIPGLPAGVIDDKVSLVDVPPTLSRYIVQDADMHGYHGEDLLGYLVPRRPERRLPILLVGTSKEVPVRLGIIDPRRPFKLVLPLESGVPELYDLRAGDPDADEVSSAHPTVLLQLLNDLVRSPMFPRMTESGAREAGR